MSRTHQALYAFHQNHIQIPEDERARLREARDQNIERLREGLSAIGTRPFSKSIGQGGYAMHTLTQRDDGEQDIDVALIFDAADLPDLALQARSLIHKAVVESAPRGFRRPPERRTNAITVWYSGGYHIDFAVYRRVRGGLEHAGREWRTADPQGAISWFSDKVKQRSPRWHPTGFVQDGQLRRVVRFMKYLRHGDAEDYPGGFIITALACQCYAPSAAGDDLAILNTIARTVRHIHADEDVREPSLGRYSLVERKIDRARLRSFGSRLGDFVGSLAPLLDSRRPVRDSIPYWEAAMGVELPRPEDD